MFSWGDSYDSKVLTTSERRHALGIDWLLTTLYNLGLGQTQDDYCSHAYGAIGPGCFLLPCLADGKGRSTIAG